MEWKLGKTLSREIKVRYPAGRGSMVLRSELDWNRDILPERTEEDGNLTVFRLECDRPFVYLKPCLRTPDGQIFWAQGSNLLAIMTDPGRRVAHPNFFSAGPGSFSDLIEVASTHLNRTVKVRAYLPAGYHENHLARYRLCLMQDGQNLFMPEEAFMGSPWDVDRTLAELDTMNAIDNFVVVGIHSADRMYEYTNPGYEHYGRFLVEELLPSLRSRLRTRDSRFETLVMGSSLGGVVSFYLAYEYPEHFAGAACLSSTFTFRDDLLDRVYTEGYKSVAFYLDSGWPGDNYEVTLAMATGLLENGWKLGQDMQHFTFPKARHNEGDWGSRLHLPAQMFARSLRDVQVARHGRSLK